MYKDRSEAPFPDSPHSGPLMVSVERYPQAGSTPMDVCFQLLSSLSVVLINVPALPTVQIFLQNNMIYFGADADAFHTRYPAPVTLVVSM